MFDTLKMQFSRLKRYQKAGVLGVPVIFFITIVVLNSKLLSSSTGGGDQRKLRLVHAHSERSAERFKPERLRMSHPSDLVYDAEKLMMLGRINDDKDQKQKEEGSSLYAFNELLSSRLSLNRAIPDTRHQLCHTQTYRSDLPKTSVIICFYNEAWSTLLRTVHSVINRTPTSLLHEIVLVDDASDLNLSHLQEKLAIYIWELHPNVTLVRTPTRQGLIRARMYGAHVATGEVLVFLDSHCEVNAQWLEPLLTSLASTKKPTIAVPVIDAINSGTFEYKESPLVKGGFNWGLHFQWEQLPADYFKSNESYIQPIETPTMAGGLFAVYRQVFRDMGEYDADLDTWGGENLEISFRFWQCGGKLEIIPCSRVGHIFRQRRPYRSPSGEDTMLRNSVRVAKVWMDEYIQHFFSTKSYATSVQYGDIFDRVALRQKLNCKPFKWYLKHIYPELQVPGESSNVKLTVPKTGNQPVYVKHGQIEHKSTQLCLQPEGGNITRDVKILLGQCASSKMEWYETSDQELMLSQKFCLEAADKVGESGYARLGKCDGMKVKQAWIWSIRNMVYQLYNPTSGKCLVPANINEKKYLVLEICSAEKQSQFEMKVT
ncbi:polypeptide N-acetylgalactosaminyltransferase 11-like [Dreissena polymorpha]|nr:polypeptide N-acetylgalactosaminyltransferase 11-like [Dreissena polymorpha]